MALRRRSRKGKETKRKTKGKKGGIRSRYNAIVHTLQRIKKFMGGQKTRKH